MTAPNGIGSELGTGLGAFAQQFVGTQNTIKQQQDALAQQQRDNQYRDQQAAAALTQNNFTNDYNDRQLAQQAARDAATLAQTGSNKRANDFQTVVSPAYTTELQGLGEVLKGYGPTTEKGAPNPSFDPARFAHASDRMKELKRLMRDVNLNTQDDAGYQTARQALLTFVGTAPSETGSVPATLGTVQPQAAPQPAPQQPAPLIDMSFAPRTTVAHGDAIANGDTAPLAAPYPVTPATETGIPASTPPAAAAQPTPEPAAPTTPAPAAGMATYQRVQDVPIDQLLTADDGSLVKQFGEGAQEYARSARGAYKAQQDAAQAAAIAAQNKLWDTKLTTILTDTTNPASPKQVDAATLITGFNSRKATGYELTPEEDAQYRKAVVDLAPDVYTPKAWQDALNTKDATQITALYKVFQSVAPGIIPPSFDITPYQTLATAASLEAATKAASTAHVALLAKYLNGAPDLKSADLITLVDIQQNPQALTDFGITTNEGREALSQAIINKRNGDTATADNLLAQATGTQTKNSTDADAATRTSYLGGASSFTDVVGKGDLTTLTAIQGDPVKMKAFGLDTPAGTQAMTDLITKIKTGDTAAANLAAATLTKMGDDHRLAGATYTATTTTTGEAAYKQASGQLGALAGTKLSALALQHQNPGLWASMKRDLGTPGHPLTDSIMTALFNDAKTTAGDADSARLLDQRVKQAQVDASKATTTATQQTTAFKAIMGGSTSLDAVVSAKDSETLRLIAGNQAARQKLGITDNGAHLLKLAQQFDNDRATSTADTVSTTKARDAKLQPELNRINAEIKAAEAAGRNTDSLIAERDKLLPGKVTAQTLGNTKTQAETAQITTMTPLNAQNLGSVIHARNVATNQSIDLLKGKLGIQQADIARIGAGTLYTQTRTPGTPQYIAPPPKGAADPNAAVYKEAGAWDAKAKGATQQLSSVNNALNALTKTLTPKFGEFNPDALTGSAKTQYDNLLTRRDALLETVKTYVKNSDDAMLKLKVPGTTGGTIPEPGAALPSGTQNARTTTLVDKSADPPFKVTEPFRTLATSLGLPVLRRATPYGQTYKWGVHNGEDIFAPNGSPIQAPFAGTVTVRHSAGDGNILELTDASGQRMFLGHLQGYDPAIVKALVQNGGQAFVSAGQRIAMVGQSGSEAHADVPNNSHTHVMAYDANGNVRNPATMQWQGVQAGPALPPGSITTNAPATKPAALGASAPPAPAAQKPSSTSAAPSSAGNWGPAAAVLPTGMKAVGSVTQYAQELRQRGWFGAVAALKAGDATGLHRLIQQATQRMLPTGTADQRLAFQRDLWDTVNN